MDHAYMVTTGTFEQYLTPSVEAAQRTAETRDGIRIDEVQYPEGLEGCYMYRGRENQPWGDWKDVD